MLTQAHCPGPLVAREVSTALDSAHPTLTNHESPAEASLPDSTVTTVMFALSWARR